MLGLYSSEKYKSCAGPIHSLAKFCIRHKKITANMEGHPKDLLEYNVLFAKLYFTFAICQYPELAASFYSILMSKPHVFLPNCGELVVKGLMERVYHSVQSFLSPATVTKHAIEMKDGTIYKYPLQMNKVVIKFRRYVGEGKERTIETTLLDSTLPFSTNIKRRLFTYYLA